MFDININIKRDDSGDFGKWRFKPFKVLTLDNTIHALKGRAKSATRISSSKIFPHTRLSRKMSSNNLNFWHQSTYKIECSWKTRSASHYFSTKYFHGLYKKSPSYVYIFRYLSQFCTFQSTNFTLYV